jgi:hypothetical protein
MKNRRGISPVSIIFISLVFIIVWSMALANIVGEQAQLAITNGGLTGVEAFILANINLVIMFLFLTFMVAIGFATGG